MNSRGGFVPSQSAHAYDAQALRVAIGANLHDPIAESSLCELGDVYRLDADARMYKLTLLPEVSDGGFQRVAEGSEIGEPGDSIELQSVLTLIAPDGETVVLRLQGGKTYTIATRKSPGQPTSEQSAFIERLTDAWEAYRAGIAPDALGLLARAGRGTLDWVRGLRALGEGQGGYRGIGLTPDHLWRIAEDASAPRESRVGAALALRSTLDDEGRRRLRVAAESSASPKVRVALEATADEVDDEAVAARIEGQARVA